MIIAHKNGTKHLNVVFVIFCVIIGLLVYLHLGVILVFFLRLSIVARRLTSL